jgi:L-ascorbate peroxidase
MVQTCFVLCADRGVLAARVLLLQPPRDTMSPEMKKRLKQEYLGLGGSPNTAMGGNYFLYIILAISVLAVLSKLTGAI